MSEHLNEKTETLTGQIERITYAAEDGSGFSIARVQVADEPGLVTIVGTLPGIKPGETLHMEGEWTDHPKYGRQFSVRYHKTEIPATVTGIRKYLASGLIKGIGPKTAEKIVDRFGEETLHIIENAPERLREVENLGTRRIRQIREAWNSQKEIRQLMVFLQGHGVSTAMAARIFKEYGENAVPVLKANPYRLSRDIYGIGFATADRIAQQLGMAADAPERIDAGILHVLQNASEDGHLYLPLPSVFRRCGKLLNIPAEALLKGVTRLAEAGDVKHEAPPGASETEPEAAEEQTVVYTTPLFLCETKAAQGIAHIVNGPRSAPTVDMKTVQERIATGMGILLAESQKKAVQWALTRKALVITGGPGTGKTTIIRAIIRIFEHKGAKVLLAAPTGRAAKRMADATDRDAKTIHRLLEYSPSTGFGRYEDHPLACDVLILDEASMIDMVLMHHLVKAVPVNAVFILVGDVNQLPSVGPGNVLSDIIASDAVPVVRLTEIFRQAEKSRIVVNAHRILQGRMPDRDNDGDDPDFFFIENREPEKVLSTIQTLVAERIPGRFHLDPFSEIQVITPMHRGVTGAQHLNKTLQDTLNPGRDEEGEEGRLRPGDKVMQIRNNYDKNVFNGDIGRVRAVRRDERMLVVRFDDRNVDYEASELNELALAFAISVHKAQGSEFPAVVMPVLSEHYMLLQRNLIYTAMTRGKQLVVMVGTKNALSIAVNNDRARTRYSFLKERIARAVKTVSPQLPF